jgi:mannose-1-phosphate guanylyltransferase / mannose-6-phosphate isomerase
MNYITPVILSGGSGTRLWPLSRSAFPKQFLSLSGSSDGKSLFQEALVRVNSINNLSFDFNTTIGNTLVVAGEDHRFLVLDQLTDMTNVNATLLLEPTGRNTAPALTMAALCAMDHDPILVVTPADQMVKDSQSFIKALVASISSVVLDQSNQTIVILGIVPTRPETGFGYIKCRTIADTNQPIAVETFAEKPNLETATRYLADGNYFWNSGMFVLRASTWLAALEVFRPDIIIPAKKAWANRSQDKVEKTLFIRPDKNEFELIPSESIDYAVIEKCPGSKFSVKMIELDVGWSDLGSWDAVWQAGKQNPDGNVSVGDVLNSNTKDTLVIANHRLVTTVGVNNLIVIETTDAVLVANKDKSQEVKEIVKQLEQTKREEKNLHRKVNRPWGWYDSVDEGERFKVKRIQVKPGASLSLQMHHHRAEHWIVVKGVAEITNGEQIITLKENESTYIPQGQKHRLANPGNTLLEIIEVQSGNYLGEDDIVRFEDRYGR